MELIINDVKLEGDLMDADFMEKFEQSMIKMRDTAQAKKRENFPTAAANYRAQSEVVNVCFDEIFGAGTADRLFHGKMNVMEHLKAIEKVSEWAASERKTLNDFTNRYTQRQQAATRQMQTAQFVSQQHGHGAVAEARGYGAGEEGDHRLRKSGGGHIPIPGRPPQQGVPNTAAHGAGLVSGLPEGGAADPYRGGHLIPIHLLSPFWYLLLA